MQLRKTNSIETHQIKLICSSYVQAFVIIFRENRRDSKSTTVRWRGKFFFLFLLSDQRFVPSQRAFHSSIKTNQSLNCYESKPRRRRLFYVDFLKLQNRDVFFFEKKTILRSHWTISWRVFNEKKNGPIMSSWGLTIEQRTLEIFSR